MASPLALLLVSVCLFLLLACGGGAVAEPTPTNPPAGTALAATALAIESSSTPSTEPTTHAPGPTVFLTFSPSPGVTPDAILGEDIFKRYGCNACHSTDGTALVGPTWQGLYGTEEELSDGTAALVDEAYIVESIKEPNARITQGFTAGLMPTQAVLGITDDEILHIIEYMKTLR